MATRQYVEEPDIEKDSEAKPEPTQQRTVQQQQKQDNLIAQKRREAGLESNRSRSSSRRDRRKRIKKDMQDGKYMHTNSLEALEEADANQEMHTMRPFERIGPDSTSMDGPVTMARAERGEIPVRGTNGGQPYYLTPKPQEKGSDLKDQDGLKLSLEANLDIEIELKASIRGDITISL
ncbi:hypothetical protein LTR85_006463 [Meristemomyces frigidus]|nr:hypothetical protein LTR85_006463 [Meristemomyces frigidus]